MPAGVQNVNTNPNRDGWDWPYILYVGRVWLRYTEREVWSLTPRQFDTQIHVHEDVTRQMYGTNNNKGSNGQSKPSPPIGYIDQIKGW